jgi:YD repeat-containing protein
LLACSAVPVFAAESVEDPSSEPTGFTPPTSNEEEIAATQVPNASEISNAIGEAEREEVEQEEWLSSPEAKQQREDSRFAFGDLSAAESEELLRSVFGEQLEALNTDPSRFLSDAQLVRPLGDSGAVVKDEGEGSLLETTVPVRTEDEEGQLAKVDLSLEATPEGFQTENAISDLVLPSSADEAIQVGEEGFEIAQGGAAASSANRFGDKNLFYPSVLTDTDLLVAGNSFGAELYDLLRSKGSPEDLRFEIGVPEGAELRSDEHGGAEVVRDGERLTLIPKPYALDAQGTEIPVALEVEGASIVVHVAHREGDYAYPALLDPIVEDWVNQGNNWYGGNNWGALANPGPWKYTRNNSNIGTEGGETCCWEGSHAGLLVNMRAAFYGPEQFGQWAYATRNAKTYITHVWLIPFNRADMGCGSAQPHDYAGLWNPGDVWSPIWLNYAKNNGNLAGDGVGQALVIGEGSGPPGVWLACNRLLYAGGVGIWLNDDWGPTISSTGIPSGWFSDADHLNIDIHAGDEGLGVHRVTVTPEGKPVIQDNVGYCTGLYGSPCPNDYTAHFAVTGDSFGEGIRSTGTVAEDPTGKTAGTQFTTKVDRTPPEVALSGQLAKATGEEVGFGQEEPPQSNGEDELSLPVYNLKIEAKDGSLTNNLTKRSGVKNIEIFLDGSKQEVPWSVLASCPETSCAMNKTYPLKLMGISAGEHTLEVKAVDFVNKTRERKIQFEFIPATGLKDEYVMQHFPLPDGQGNEDEEEHPARPELAVNVVNGNLVYRERDIDIEGPAVDLEVERFFNSQLPNAQNTEWGDGWTLAQTPGLEPVKSEGSPVPDRADLISNGGALESDIALPTKAGEEKFNPALQSTLTKKSSGGYELTDETGQSSTSVSFSEAGRTEARLTEGYARVDYAYEGGSLAEIAVDDPASAGGGPPEGAEEPPAQAADVPAYAESFGSVGSGNGQLKAPGDLAVDGQGNLWVLDTNNNRVEKFNSKGQYLAQFGSTGSGNGQFKRPAAIAIAANDDLLIADAGNTRIERFNSKGEYLSQFGSKGSANGQFGGTIIGTGPEGLAIDAAGSIWVADTVNGRIEKFNSKGEFLKSVGSKGTGAGQLTQPMGIAFDAGGNLWAAEYGNNRLTVFNGSGEYLSQVGSAGSGNGQFSHPDAIEIDSHGNVWVSDVSNSRVERFDVAGQYRGQFGAKGSGAGQFNFVYATGIASDDSGAIWVTDPNNNRVQKWVIPEYLSTYSDVIYDDAFGTSGSGDGQLSAPADVAIDQAGNSWVADRANNRIEKFNSKGEFVSKFGSLGTANGQFKNPTAVAIDLAGNVLVLDRGNQRIEKFSPSGEYLSKFGSKGTGNGQFEGSPLLGTGPEGLAIDAHGNIWVADTNGGRLEKFGPEGEFLKVVGSKGSGAGQFGKPSGIDIGPGGKIWVADWQYNRVAVFNNAGEYISQFGAEGSANGQFNHPDAIDVDAKGDIWVGDQGNNRVQLFDHEGKYADQFGSKGSGEEQLSLASPMGVTTDGSGGVWVTDTVNNRVQKWVAGNYFPDPEEEAPEPNDPAVEVDVSAGLVDAVSGEEAGVHEYAHVGNLLSAHDGPQGETTYEYDSAHRLTKVTLPNGTIGSIAYFSDGRVKSVTVDPAGAEPAKKTEFEYSDEPRRTVVILPDAPHVTYDIGADGSVLKWWNALQPPQFDDIAGTLYDNRGKEIWAGDHNLYVQAHSEEGIASIKVVANGTDLVDEKTCPQTEGIGCLTEIDEWVTSTEEHPPGRLDLEVIITDRLGQMAAERFWVNIPPPPPPLAPGTPIPPKFRDIAKFREEFGLDVVDPVANEVELNERIFNLIKAWYEANTPEGLVARASEEQWGVPMRPMDISEMEYRERYIDQASTALPGWTSTHGASPVYAGYYVDHRAGGIIYVGFTSAQQERVNELKQQAGLIAAGRVRPFPILPAHSLGELESLQLEVLEASANLSSNPVISASVNIKQNRVDVGATDVAGGEAFIHTHFGAASPISVYYQPQIYKFAEAAGNQTGPVKAGERLRSEVPEVGECSAGWGAWDQGGTKADGSPLYRYFLTTAGHCFAPGAEVTQWDYSIVNNKTQVNWRRQIGYVRRYSFNKHPSNFATDAEAISLADSSIVPRLIRYSDTQSIRVHGATTVSEGMVVCRAGAFSPKVKCGAAEWPPKCERWGELRGNGDPVLCTIRTEIPIAGGDSGGPYWARASGDAVGTLTGGWGPASWFTPVEEIPGYPKAQGSLNALGIEGDPLHLVKAK